MTRWDTLLKLEIWGFWLLQSSAGARPRHIGAAVGVVRERQKKKLFFSVKELLRGEEDKVQLFKYGPKKFLCWCTGPLSQKKRKVQLVTRDLNTCICCWHKELIAGEKTIEYHSRKIWKHWKRMYWISFASRFAVFCKYLSPVQHSILTTVFYRQYRLLSSNILSCEPLPGEKKTSTKVQLFKYLKGFKNVFSRDDLIPRNTKTTFQISKHFCCWHEELCPVKKFNFSNRTFLLLTWRTPSSRKPRGKHLSPEKHPTEMEDEISRSISIAMKTTSKFFPPGKKKYPTFTNTSDLKTLFWHEELLPRKKKYPTFTNTSDLKTYSVLGMKNSFQERKNIQLSQTLQISKPFFGMKNSFQERKMSNFHKQFRSQNPFLAWRTPSRKEKYPTFTNTSDFKPYSVLGMKKTSSRKEKYPTPSRLQISNHILFLAWKKNIQLSQTVQISKHILLLAWRTPSRKEKYPTFTNTSDLKTYSVLGMKNSSRKEKYPTPSRLQISNHILFLARKKNIQLSQTLQISKPFFGMKNSSRKEKYITFTNTSDPLPLWSTKYYIHSN